MTPSMFHDSTPRLQHAMKVFRAKKEKSSAWTACVVGHLHLAALAQQRRDRADRDPIICGPCTQHEYLPTHTRARILPRPRSRTQHARSLCVYRTDCHTDTQERRLACGHGRVQRVSDPPPPVAAHAPPPAREVSRGGPLTRKGAANQRATTPRPRPRQRGRRRWRHRGARARWRAPASGE